MAAKMPTGLAAGGRTLWREISTAHDLDAAQVAQLTEACRAKDRLDKLDALLRGDVDAWCSLLLDANSSVTLVINGALTQANATANMMKQLLAALRLPDEATGKRPQFRGPRGAQRPTVPGGSVSSLERARAAKSS